MYWLSSLLFPTLSVIAFVVIGVVVGPRIGAASGRMWLGLVLMIGAQVLTGLLTVGLNMLFLRSSDYDPATYGALSTVGSLVGLALSITGVALLATAAIRAKNTFGPVDPARPGAAPGGYGAGGGYAGPGYPPAGGALPPQPGTTPPGPAGGPPQQGGANPYA